MLSGRARGVTLDAACGTGRFAEFLASRGHQVIGVHHDLITHGSVIKARGPASKPCIAATYRHRLGDYLRPALSLGFQVRRCEEPGAAGPPGPLFDAAPAIGDWQDWPWSLNDYLPSAARASGGRPWLVIWHFQLPVVSHEQAGGGLSQAPDAGRQGLTCGFWSERARVRGRGSGESNPND